MTKYNWNIYDIEERLKKLYTLLAKEKDNKKRMIIQYDIQRLRDKIDEYFDYTIYDQETLLKEYGYRKEDYRLFDFLKTDFIEFNQIANDLIVAPPLTNMSLSKKDMLDLTHDFYKNLNRFFFGNFMKNYARRYDHITFNNTNDKVYKGATTFILSLKESFIEVNRDFTLMDVITIIHEYMHATSAIINPYHCFDNNWIFSELDTSFIELVAIDYLEGIFKNNNGIILKAFNHMERVSDVMDLTDTFKIMSYEDSLSTSFANNKQLKTAARLACDLTGEELEDIFFTDDTQPETYVIGYLFGVELYDLYLSDKEKALNTLRKIIEMKYDTIEDYYKQIKNLGLFPNQHMREYHKNLQSDVNKLLRIKEKNQR